MPKKKKGATVEEMALKVKELEEEIRALKIKHGIPVKELEEEIRALKIQHGIPVDDIEEDTEEDTGPLSPTTI
ncbi:hypothetical protein T484DRAFT_1807236 [Baffinella frigidus]|nr:hypothetical protein T484DRAFT_1807236 [Cryptophyta sp. CCMP2293]